MSSYKLVYFNARGRAEVARLIFAQAGVKYEDKRVTQEEWTELKPSTPTGQLPLLEVDGRTITGSGPLSRLLAERLGMAGNNDLENAEIASIIDVLEDFFIKVIPMFYEKDEAKKAELKKNIVDNEIPKYFGILEKKASANSGNWIYSEKITYADLAIFNALDFFTTVFPNILDGRPGITKLKESVESLPNIAHWLKERPQTDH